MTETFTSGKVFRLKKVGDFETPSFITRHPDNPVLTASKMPYRSHLVFNSSVVEYDGKYLMMFRNEWFPEEGNPAGFVSSLGVAQSDDGINWDVWPEPIRFEDDRLKGKHVYDPRALIVDGTYYVTACVHDARGPRGVTMTTEDFRTFEVIDLAPPCSRNLVLFPEKINGKYYRLERPFWASIDTYNNQANEWVSPPFDIYIASSPDLKHWGDYEPLLQTDLFDYANIKIGPGGAPIRTDRGWLLLLHGVDYDPSRGKNGWNESWRQRYHGGVALLDLENPRKVLGYSKLPVITPEAPYETENGFRNGVIFPMTGLQMPDGDFYIYYGAADTHTCVATCQLDDLLDFALSGPSAV
jgi:beta-1,4-mannooligosaccharide/beta-1,4-mannosyl-N-acetylglucosamine phosphorylase